MSIALKSGIYAIINMTNGKRYIGQSKDIRSRGNKHFSLLLRGCHHCQHLQNAFLKYGKDFFRRVVLEVCACDSLTQREQYWMDHYRGRGIYNATAAAGSNLGMRFTEEHKAKISRALTGRVRSPEYCANIAAAAIGHKMSEENKLKLSERAKNGTAGIMSPESKAKSIATRTGRKMSEEQKAKIAATLKGRAPSPQTAAKIAAANTGKKRTPETRARMSAAWYRVNRPLQEAPCQSQR